MSSIRWGAPALAGEGPVVNVDAGVASGSGTGEQAFIPSPFAYPYSADASGQAYDATISVSKTAYPTAAYATGRAHKVYAGIEHPVVTTGTKFILRDIARLPFNTDIQGYAVRFRVVSHDRNRVSSWSPFYNVTVPDEMIPSGSNINLINVAYTVNTQAYGVDDSLITVMWEQIPGVESVDVYEQPSASAPSNQWIYRGRQRCDQLSNIVQFKRPNTDGSWKFSFHRPQISPQSGTNTSIYPSRIFITDEILAT